MSIQAVVSGLALVVAVGGATVLYERNQQLEDMTKTGGIM